MTATLLVLLGLGAQSAAGADDSMAKAKAQALLDQGLEHYDRAEFASALGRFNEAYGTYPSPRLWFNIGQAEQALHRPVDALRAFTRFMAEATEVPVEYKAKARAAIAQLQQELARLRVGCNAVGCDLSLDGHWLGKSPLYGDIWITAGDHVVSAQRGTARATERVRAHRGQLVTVYLEPLPPGGPRRAPDRPALSTMAAGAGQVSTRATAGWWLGRKWTWVAVGTAVASAAGATTLGLLMQSRYDELDRSCGSASAAWAGCSDDDLSSLERRKTAANVLWGTAAVATVAATVLFVVEGRPVALSPVVGGTIGLAARTRF